MRDDEMKVTIAADTAPFVRALDELRRGSEDFGSALTGAMRSAAAGGKALDQVLRQLVLGLSQRSLARALAPVESMASSLLSGLFGGLAPGGRAVPFANGGIVSQPSWFPMGNSLGLMGEAGPEAILPLARGPDGRLGVAGPGGGGTPVTINFHVSAPDPAAFARSEAQISAMIAGAVARGMR